ncbi:MULTISPECIES: tellurite resistance TerB family protein [Rhizobium]|uniref:Tellurite resistance protein TerB n=1 Tax=Rhizobium tropici TaxID=398 RepID=A0A329YGP7_RHITR|nr:MULTISPECIES: tellurite resistance TerB family protein [Rhizobium]KAA1185842.1 Tellurite resistance protein TerB [Rhizobium tropici]MBB3287540.1 tellurite resistance protein [Rhizobium sp. BK252]MBB3402280.1 tellurite resistance protein [Rhizobium sp. BK289]MBB3414857.1 tellurite resistance protein [Rhizobium sp. BK284]MBB3482746.1 tellurite resistance protein [Rhizobium sp. BK347]
MNKPLSAHEALIYVMVLASAVDRTMNDRELSRIGELIHALPVFKGFDDEKLISVSRDCAKLLSNNEGLDIVLETVRDTLPARLYDTAYALAVEVASADLSVKAEELRLLSLLRDRFGLDKLTCAAIERSAIARYRKA